MRDALVGSDRLGPDRALGRVARRGAQGVARDADAEGGSGDPFGIQAVENLPEPLPFLADQCSGADPDAIEVQGELALRQQQVDREQVLAQAWGIGRDDEQGQPAAALVLPGPRDHQQGLRLVDPGDVVLGAVQDPVVAVLARRGRDAQGVRARVRLGDREHHLDGAAGQAGQPGPALLVGAESGDHLGRDRGRHEQQEQRRARGGDLLADQGEFGQPSPAAAVLLRNVDADEPSVAEGLPQFGAGAAGRGPFGVIAGPELGGNAGHGGPERPVFLRLGKVHAPVPDCDSPFTSDLSAWMRHWLVDILPSLQGRRFQPRPVPLRRQEVEVHGHSLVPLRRVPPRC